MTKMIKKIAAMGAAIMVMASISAMGASAIDEYNSYAYGSSPRVSGSVWTFSGSKKAVQAATSNGGDSNVSAHAVITYKNTSGTTKTYGNGNSGISTIGVTVVPCPN